MIKKLRHKGFHTYVKDGDRKLIEIFDDILSCNVKTIGVDKVFKSEPHTHVSLLNTQHGPYVMKIYAPGNKLIERFIKSLFSASYNVNLIKKIDHARNCGFQFPNDFFLLAERRFLNFAKVSIMLFEYIPGKELSELPVITPDMKNELKAAVQKMHELEIISGDAHKGNFIMSDEGIRIIDLCGKPYNKKRAVEDNLTMNLRIGVPFEVSGIWQKAIVAKKMHRHNKLKVRKGNPEMNQVA